MTKLKSYIGKQVMLKDSIFTFNSEVVETDDPALISTLSKADDVELVKEGKKEKADKAE
jgi:hypothetical protein